MALNFPTDTTNPYIDVSSGIKYVYNTAVGAWEAAIQPPAIVSNTTPALAIEGFFWWDADDEILYVYQGGQWKPAGGGSGGGGNTSVSVSDTPPNLPAQGDLWWDTHAGVLFIYYVDPDGGTFWTPASPSVSGGSGGGVTSSQTAPPEAAEGDLWFNTLTNVLSVYHSNAWVSTQPPAEGVQSISGTAPITVTGTNEDPVINVTGASTGNAGVVELASQSEVNVGTVSSKAITPLTLQANLAAGVHLPTASDTTAGIVELADDSEAISGTDSARAVTPASLAAKLATLGGGNPAGTIITFAGSTAPTDYLACDGAAVSRTDYADLFAVCGVLYGAGDGSTTFNLPDLRGEFVRGWDDGRGVDSGRSLGTTQNSSNKDHTHTITDPGHNHSYRMPVDGQHAGGSGTGRDTASTNSTTGDQTTGITIDNQGESEARPRNIALLYCIKF